MSRDQLSRSEQKKRTAEQVQQAAPGLTSRQLEYWLEQGYLISDEPRVQGHARTFSPDELRVLTVLHRLTGAGFPAALAASIARRAAAQAAVHPGDRLAGVRLAEGIWLQLEL